MRVFGQGIYTAAFCTVALPVDEVQALIPEESRLGAQTLAPPGTHPVIFMLGRHHDVHSLVLRIPFAPTAYHEASIAVPWIESRGHTYSTLPTLSLDSLWYVLAGWLWGFPKRRQRIDAQSDSFRVTSLLFGRPVISLTHAPAGPWRTTADYPLAAGVAATLDLPFLQTYLRWSPVSSQMGFQFREAKMVGLNDAVLDVAQGFDSKLQPRTIHVPSIEHDALGAFLIEIAWTISFPYPEPS